MTSGTAARVLWIAMAGFCKIPAHRIGTSGGVDRQMGGRPTMKVPLLLAASAILSLASTATLAEDANTPPPAAAAKTAPPAAPPRPYTEDDCQEMNAQLDDSIGSSNLEAAFVEKIRQQRAGADQSCNSGDYAAGPR